MKNTEEERNLILDKPGKGKSLDTIKKHTIDTGFENKPIDRAMHLLTCVSNAMSVRYDCNNLYNNYQCLEELFVTGDDVQKISVIQALPQLQIIDSNATLNRILPKIQQDLSHSSCEIQVTASRVFKTLFESSSNINLLNSVISGVESKDPTVSLAWSDSLISIIPTLPEDVIKNNILPIAKNKTATNATVFSKVFCSKVLGKISVYPKLRTIDIKKDILPITLSLCQDVNPDVRTAICTNLPQVAQGLGNAFTKTNLLPSLVELACDENCNVRSAAIVSISAIIVDLDKATKVDTMIPLLKKLCDKAISKSDATAITLANEFGALLIGLENCLSQADIQYFLNCFKTFSQRGKISAMPDSRVDASSEVICRERCAKNTLSVLKFGLKEAPDQVPFIYGIYRELAADPCYLVRRSATANIAMMAQLLGEQNKLMKNEIIRLLRDDAIEVLDLLVPNVASTLLCLCDYGTMNSGEANQMTNDIGRALFKCHTELSKVYNWRLTVQFLTQLECLPFCMPCDFIHNNFTPVLLDKAMNGKARPIRIQAIRTLVVFLRFNFKPNQHKWLRDTLIKQIALSNSCYTRVLYVALCEAVLDHCSEKYFKEHMLPNLLKLAVDRISNIRYAFVQITTRLKNMATLQNDAKTRQLINDTITKLESTEKCKVIVELLRLKKRDPLPKRVEERIKEEDRRVHEETAGVIQRPSTNVSKQISTKPASTAARSETPPAAQEMAFLEQHFYIDAGISLPKENAIHLNNVDDIVDNDNDCDDADADDSNDELPPIHIINLSDSEYETSNMTDDVKVNLRLRMKKNNKSKIVPPKIYKTSSDDDDDSSSFNTNTKPKRYSSIISAECIVAKETKLQNRRSLNISCLTSSSRIPVSVINAKVNVKGLCAVKVDENSLDTLNNKSKSVSNLPILIKRRSVPPKRKSY